MTTTTMMIMMKEKKAQEEDDDDHEKAAEKHWESGPRRPPKLRRINYILQYYFPR